MKKQIWIVFFLFSLPLHAFEWRVVDGDTLASNDVKFRLYGIDCPESDQAFGDEATAFVEAIAVENDFRIEEKSTDLYGRIVVLVYFGDYCLNEELVRAGYAWVYTKYCTLEYETNWLKLQYDAESNNLGLWNDEEPMAPWDWR